MRRSSVWGDPGTASSYRGDRGPGPGLEALTVSVVRSRMLSDEAPMPMSKAPGSTAEPIVPPWYQAVSYTHLTLPTIYSV